MSLAFCISASSCADLIIRQPRTTGAPGRISTWGMACRSPSTAKKRTLSSIPTGPERRRSRRKPATVRKRILILVPDPDVRRHLQALADRRLLEMRGHDAGLAACRDDRSGQPLAEMPVDAGEIDHRCAGLDQQCGKPGLDHQPLRPGDAGEMLVAGDRARRRRSSTQARAPAGRGAAPGRARQARPSRRLSQEEIAG